MRRVDDVLAIASWVSAAVLVVALLILQPLLTIAVAAPVELFVRRRTERARWQQIAMTDAVTGLLNTYGWQRQAGQALTSAADRRPRCGPAVVVVDIDRFKIINDTYGHPTGNVVLRAVGAALTSAFRGEDIVGRIGGDESAVGLRAVTPAELARLAERIRAAISSTPVMAADGCTVTDLSVSVGAAVSPLEPASVRELLAAADSVLYKAKAGGRNAARFAVLTMT
jgi:diguanylate cyclase (GGDEF)-like protein